MGKSTSNATQLELLPLPEPDVILPRQKKTFHTKKDLAFHPAFGIPSVKTELPLSTFESFLKGPSNEEAISLALRIADGSLTSPPLIFFHGAMGTGKTHIFNAIFAKASAASIKARLLHATELSEIIATHLERKSTSQMILDFSSFNILLIDDIPSLKLTPEGQEIFCRLFDSFAMSEKLILISGTDSPEKLKGLPPRMMSRIERSAIVTLHNFDPQLARSFVDQRSEKMTLPLEPALKKLISEIHGDDGHRLERALATLKALQTTCPNADMDEQKRHLKGLSEKTWNEKKALELIKKLALAFSLSEEDILRQRRSKAFSYPRHILMYLLKESLGLSISRIATLLNKDRASVLYGISKISKLRETDVALHEMILSIEV